MSRIIFSLLISFSITISYGDARILNVPNDFETIQAGIDATEDGDTVLVQPGIYSENLLLQQKTIVLGSLLLTTDSEEFINSTILDGNNSRSTVRIVGETPGSSLLRGFTIRNGYARPTYGGGIYCGGNQHVGIEDMIISENRTDHQGGGIYAQEGTHIKLKRSKIRNNRAEDGGGGAYLRSRVITVEDCEFTSNNSGNVSGLRCTGNTMLNRVLIARNHGNSCSALLVNGNELSINQLTVTANTVDTLFASNSALFIEGDSTGQVRMSNSIVYGNDFPQVGFRLDSLILSYCNIDGLDEGIRPNQDWCNFRITDSFDSDPLFVDAENGDYSLTADSPCIDAGDPNSSPDPDGTRADMGAFYFHQRGDAPQFVEHFPVELELSLSQGDTLSFRIRAEDAEGDSIRYLWRFGEETISVDSMTTLNFNDTGAFVLQCLISDGHTADSISWNVTVMELAVPNDILHPSLFTLHSAYPNPFNATTTIRFSTGSQAAPTRLAVYDLSGRLVADLLGSTGVSAGQGIDPAAEGGATESSAVWNASSQPAGVYFVRLEAGGKTHILKTVLLK